MNVHSTVDDASLLVPQADLVLTAVNNVELSLHFAIAHLVSDLAAARIIDRQDELRRIRLDLDDGCRYLNLLALSGGGIELTHVVLVHLLVEAEAHVGLDIVLELMVLGGCH